ncbi:hypothetical protein DFH09DRAFT_1461894 [Mycena vulgaris]|nr:hypothetical protein DFH09DRAFT_1461894 [Mycena vulgaris]
MHGLVSPALEKFSNASDDERGVTQVYWGYVLGMHSPRNSQRRRRTAGLSAVGGADERHTHTRKSRGIRRDRILERTEGQMPDADALARCRPEGTYRLKRRCACAPGPGLEPSSSARAQIRTRGAIAALKKLTNVQGCCAARRDGCDDEKTPKCRRKEGGESHVRPRRYPGARRDRTAENAEEHVGRCAARVGDPCDERTPSWSTVEWMERTGRVGLPGRSLRCRRPARMLGAQSNGRTAGTSARAAGFSIVAAAPRPRFARSERTVNGSSRGESGELLRVRLHRPAEDEGIQAESEPGALSVVQRVRVGVSGLRQNKKSTRRAAGRQGWFKSISLGAAEVCPTDLGDMSEERGPNQMNHAENETHSSMGHTTEREDETKTLPPDGEKKAREFRQESGSSLKGTE